MRRSILSLLIVLCVSACQIGPTVSSNDGSHQNPGTPDNNRGPDTPTNPSNPNLPGHGGGGSGGGSLSTTPFQIADQINVVTAGEGAGKVSMSGVARLLRALNVGKNPHVTAFDGPGTDYTNDKANFFVHLDALEPLDTANMIMCYMSQLGASDASTLNAGNYLALIDPSECERGKSGGNQDSGESSGGVTVQRERMVVNNSRADDNSPQIVRIWLEGGDGKKIRGEMTVKAGAAEAPPFGIFTFNWVEIKDDALHPKGKGSLVVFNRDPQSGELLPNNKVGLTLYTEEKQNFDDHNNGPGINPSDVFGESATFVRAASAVMGTDANGKVIDGVALTQLKVMNGDTGELLNIEQRLADLGASEQDFDIDQFSRTFALSYNNDNLLLQEAHLYEQLPFVLDANNAGSGTCLSRQEFEQAVWCYNLYDSTSGDRVNLQTGFPFTIQKDVCGEKPLFGHLSYFGAWFEGQNLGIDGCSLENGDVIKKQNFDGGAEQEYELVRSTGRLIKNTVLKLSLAELRGIRLDMNELPTDGNRFRDPSLGEGEDPYSDLKSLRNSGDYPIGNWVVYYLTHADDGVSQDGFYIVGFLVWGDRGPKVTLLADVVGVQGLQARYDVTPRSIDGQQLWMFSQQLGGGVRYTKGQNFITYNKEEFVDPRDALFNGSDTPVQLRCMFGCLKPGITDQDQQSFDGPMYGNDAYTVVGDGLRYVSYQVARTDLALQDLEGHNVTLAEGAHSSGMYSWGINMGPLVTQAQLEAIDNWWDIWNTEGVVFYRWETGSNSWNATTTARLAGTSDFVSFDKPIEFTYTHHTENDRSGDSTFDNQVFLLSYQGSCQLQGIPQKDVGGDKKARFYPAFGLKDGTLLGPNDEYVVKAFRGEQKPEEVVGQCSALVVANPAVAIPDHQAAMPSNFNTSRPEVEVVKVDNGVVLTN